VSAHGRADGAPPFSVRVGGVLPVLGFVFGYLALIAAILLPIPHDPALSQVVTVLFLVSFGVLLLSVPIVVVAWRRYARRL
jgi:hypothetical protein